ncbi:MAG: peptide chain release factor N(5)-glutamine methyltransferase [Christensenellales bacterium]
MKYFEAKNKLIDEYKKFDSGEFGEIDYCFSEILSKSALELKFCDVSESEFEKAKKVILEHLTTNKPLQKIFGKAYFYGLEFFVDENVLTPRFDSEILVENALKFDFDSCLDLCSGSGCLGLAIKKNKPKINLVLADISNKALKVSKKNAKSLNLDAKFVKTDMFENISEKFDLIVCNPPYIETETIKTLSAEVKNFDPKIALDGGKDGLKFYRILADEIDEHLSRKGKCLIEIGYNQKVVKEMFQKKFENVTLLKDYNGLDRLIIIDKEKEKLC